MTISFASPLALAQTGGTSSASYEQAYSSDEPGQSFYGNVSLLPPIAVSISFVGVGGNDTFWLLGGNGSASMAATGVENNTYNVVTGNPTAGINRSVFSMLTGDNSTFNIVQNNFNGTVILQIVGGTDCLVNATSEGPVSSTVFSVVLGANSTADIASELAGNETAINIIS